MLAEAITFNLNWEGQTLGYGAEGSFSYDESSVPDDGIVILPSLRGLALKCWPIQTRAMR